MTGLSGGQIIGLLVTGGLSLIRHHAPRLRQTCETCYFVMGPC
jgi:hypothetical protein